MSTHDAPVVVRVDHLHKRYGSTVAVDDVSLTVRAGEIVGILGPNGAGKTTTVEIVAGLRDADRGTVEVLGLDPARDGLALRERVGLQLQESALPARLEVREALELYASLYRDPADPDELLAELGLTDKARTQFGKLSGGQKQRLSIALALVGNPQIAILDELTTGLDPQARRETWQFVERVRERGVTVVLVTHFMEEAERLCDRIVLIDRGRVAAQGTPAELAARASGDQVLTFRPSAPVPDAVLRAVAALADVRDVQHAPQQVEVHGAGNVVQDVLVALAGAGIRPLDLRLQRSSLEDAFVALTRDPDGSRPGAVGADPSPALAGTPGSRPEV